MKTKLVKILLWASLLFAISINFLGALSPELGFDALWYHLTIPKLYLLAGEIYHIPGGLLYYSEMPRLAEFIYIPLIKLAGDTGPHLLNWFAGLGSAFLIYKISRKYLDQITSLLATCLFYTTPLVGWQSGSAYVDLLRTFFEVLSFYLIIQKRIFISGIILGLAISTKTLALGSVPILFIISWISSKKFLTAICLPLAAILISFPWFLSAYNNTGFPLYPIGANILDSTHTLNFDFWNLPRDYLKLFIFPDDIVSPVFVLFLPFLLFVKNKSRLAIFLIYFVLSLVIWFITPRTGGGRFILPYLPVWSVLVGLTIFYQKNKFTKLLLISLVIGSIFVNVTYRAIAISRNIPYLMRKQTKEEFLCARLDFNTSVFVDCDGFFKKTIKATDLVLVKNMHNLFYINFPFVHESWYKGENYNYILSGALLKNKKTIYQNQLSKIYLYKR